jgi:hypothetical protein
VSRIPVRLKAAGLRAARHGQSTTTLNSSRTRLALVLGNCVPLRVTCGSDQRAGEDCAEIADIAMSEILRMSSVTGDVPRSASIEMKRHAEGV